jgi:hypothetical protein
MRAGSLIHRITIQKLDHAVAADWQDFSEAPVPCLVTREGDVGDGTERYRVEMRWHSGRDIVKGGLDLGYGFLFLWSDPQTDTLHKLQVESAIHPTEKLWKNPAIFSCTRVQPNE